MKRAVERLNRTTAPQLTVANINQLQSYDWPGNIRELENVIERAVILSRGGKLAFDLPKPNGPDARPGVLPIEGQEPDEFADAQAVAAQSMQIITSRSDLQRAEIEAIRAALTECAGKVSGPGGAAERLAMKPTTLYSRLKKLNIDARSFKP